MAERDGTAPARASHIGDLLIADDTFTVIAGEVHRRIALSDPGVDDYRNELLWSPETPTMIDADIELWGERGEQIDTVCSYTALRSVAVSAAIASCSTGVRIGCAWSWIRATGLTAA